MKDAEEELEEFLRKKAKEQKNKLKSLNIGGRLPHVGGILAIHHDHLGIKVVPLKETKMNLKVDMSDPFRDGARIPEIRMPSCGVK